MISASIDYLTLVQVRKNGVPEICGQKYIFSTYVVLYKETACNVIVKENSVKFINHAHRIVFLVHDSCSESAKIKGQKIFTFHLIKQAFKP